MTGMTGTIAAGIAAQYHNAGQPVPQWLTQGLSSIQHNSLQSRYDARYVDPEMWKNASPEMKMQFLGKRDPKGNLVVGQDGGAVLDAWTPEKLAQMSLPYDPAEQDFRQRNNAWGAPGQAQPIQPQTQGTPYPSAAPQLPATEVQQTQAAAPVTRDRFGRPVQPGSIEEDIAADSAAAGWMAGWDQEASRRGVDPATGAPLANRTAEQEAYHRAAYSPQNDQLPPQNEGLLAYLRQRDAPKQPAQAQQLYRTDLNAHVPGQALAFEQDAFRNMAQRAVDREAFHGANDPYVQQFVNRMQYQGFDPRQGLTASQHIQDALAVRQRNDAIRANPMAYLRGEL